jgi:hypothetical protein
LKQKSWDEKRTKENMAQLAQFLAIISSSVMRPALTHGVASTPRPTTECVSRIVIKMITTTHGSCQFCCSSRSTTLLLFGHRGPYKRILYRLTTVLG